MRKINEIIIHCSATKEGQDFKEKDIDQWHKAKGWKSCGYHYVIDLDGKVERGRADSEVGAHCSGRNANSIGICIIGGLDKYTGEPKDTRTIAQKEALLDLIYLLCQHYSLHISSVHCHNEFTNKACPSFRIEDFREEYLNTF